MGNNLDTYNNLTKSSPKKVTCEDLEWKKFLKVYKEGSNEYPEDPEFPKQLLDKTLENDYKDLGIHNQGTYVYYPGEQKVKMWIGKYKCVNPDDIINWSSGMFCDNPMFSLWEEINQIRNENNMNCWDTQGYTNCYNPDETAPIKEKYRLRDDSYIETPNHRISSEDIRQDNRIAQTQLRNTVKIMSGTKYAASNMKNELTRKSNPKSFK